MGGWRVSGNQHERMCPFKELAFCSKMCFSGAAIEFRGRTCRCAILRLSGGASRLGLPLLRNSDWLAA